MTTTAVAPPAYDSAGACLRVLTNTLKAIEALSVQGKSTIRIRNEDEEVWYTAGDIPALEALYNRWFPLCATPEMPDLRVPRGQPARAGFLT